MARPKVNSDVAPANVRLTQAFWEALSQKPLAEISVTELCRRAGCNKTTFYYHFTDIDDLVAHIEGAFEEMNLPALFVDIVLGGNLAGKQDELIAYFEDDLARASLLLGPGGDHSFSQKIQAAMRGRWCEFLGVAEEDLDPYDVQLLRYSMSGTVCLLSDPGKKADYRLLLQMIVDVMTPQVDRMMAKYNTKA